MIVVTVPIQRAAVRALMRGLWAARHRIATINRHPLLWLPDDALDIVFSFVFAPIQY
jgi:hypothetical protein